MENSFLDVEEFPLTEKEIADWLENLGKNDTQRASRLRDMLHFANSDDMSLRDRQICRDSLSRLETKANIRRVK